jgi:PKD repeat protein
MKQISVFLLMTAMVCLSSCYSMLQGLTYAAGPGADPVARFSSTLQQQGAISFFNESQYGLNYRWDFGDNSYSTDQSPTHQYKRNGNYTVMLTTTNAIGKTSTTQRDVYVTGVVGSVMFYLTFESRWSVDVYINNVLVGAITDYWWISGLPQCGQSGIKIDHEPGTYAVSAKQRVMIGGRSWSGLLTIDANKCMAYSFNK